MQKSLKEAADRLCVFCLSRKNTVEVKYSQSLPVLDWFKSSDYGKAEKILLTKSEIWQNEDEWRIIETKGPGYYEFDSYCLKGIILAVRQRRNINY